MSKISKWLLTDGGTIKDPRDRAVVVESNAKTETFTIKLALDPKSSDTGRVSVLRDISDSLIKTLVHDLKWNRADVARALNVSSRTVYTRLERIDAAMTQ